MEKLMSAIGFLFLLIIYMVQLAVIIAVFGVLHSKFEVIVVSSLGFIWVAIRSMSFDLLTRLIARGVIRTLQLLKDDNPYIHKFDVSEPILKARDYLDRIFVVIVQFICLCEILSVLG